MSKRAVFPVDPLQQNQEKISLPLTSNSTSLRQLGEASIVKISFSDIRTARIVSRRLSVTIVTS